MSEKVLAVELTDLDKEKRVSVITDQRLVEGAFGSSYAKNIVKNIQSGMSIEQATEAAKAGLTRWTSVPLDKVIKVKHVDNSTTFSVSYQNEKKQTCYVELAVEEKPNRQAFLAQLQEVLPTLKYQSSAGSLWEAISGHLIALVFVLIIGAVLIGAAFAGPEYLQKEDNGTGRRKGRALAAMIFYVAGLLGPAGSIGITVLVVGVISYFMMQDAKNPPTRHELISEIEE